MAGDIEFLDADPSGDAPGEDDRRAPDGPRHATGSRRARLAAVIAGGVVLAGVLVARIGTSDDHAPAAAPRSPSPSATSAVGQLLDPSSGKIVYCYTIVTIPDRPIGVSGEPSGGRQTVALPTGDVGPRPEPLSPSVSPHEKCATTSPAPCPRTKDGSDCTSTATLPDRFLAAVQRKFPGARVLSAQTFVVSATHRLWERTVTLAQGYARITVVVGRHGTDLGPSIAHDDGSHLQLRAVADTPTAGVLVLVTLPSGARASLQSIIDFATEPDLAAL